MHVALENTDTRRIAEASPHDKVWGIGMTAFYLRAASPTSWCGLNLISKALERTRQTTRQNATVDTKLDILVARDDD